MIEVNSQDAADKAVAVKRGELPGPARSLAEAVVRVMEQVGYVQKDKKMQAGGSYRYASVEAVIDALRPEMLRQQLVLLPAGVEPLKLEVVEGRNSRQNRTQVLYTFKLIHAPTGQSEPVVVIGEAMDVGDKSSNKAMTAARKYALILAFNIETGDDPDDTPSRDQQRASGTPRDNPPLRQAVLAAVKDCLHWPDMSDLMARVKADADAGKFSPTDLAAIREAIEAWKLKNPKPKPQGAK